MTDKEFWERVKRAEETAKVLSLLPDEISVNKQLYVLKTGGGVSTYKAIGPAMKDYMTFETEDNLTSLKLLYKALVKDYKKRGIKLNRNKK